MIARTSATIQELDDWLDRNFQERGSDLTSKSTWICSFITWICSFITWDHRFVDGKVVFRLCCYSNPETLVVDPIVAIDCIRSFCGE